MEKITRGKLRQKAESTGGCQSSRSVKKVTRRLLLPTENRGAVRVRIRIAFK